MGEAPPTVSLRRSAVCGQGPESPARTGARRSLPRTKLRLATAAVHPEGPGPSHQRKITRHDKHTAQTGSTNNWCIVLGSRYSSCIRRRPAARPKRRELASSALPLTHGKRADSDEQQQLQCTRFQNHCSSSLQQSIRAKEAPPHGPPGPERSWEACARRVELARHLAYGFCSS